jgi:hypothetical protein
VEEALVTISAGAYTQSRTTKAIKEGDHFPALKQNRRSSKKQSRWSVSLLPNLWLRCKLLRSGTSERKMH